MPSARANDIAWSDGVLKAVLFDAVGTLFRVRGSVGAAYAGTLPADTSQYKFGAKVIFGPEVGVRWYLTRRLAMRFDTKMIFWKLSYPLEYRVPPTTCTGGTDCTALVGVSDPLTEWTHHFWFNVRVGWTF